jgi:septum formation protein
VKFILGSGSPRRAEILKAIGIAHEVMVAQVDESPAEGEAPLRYLERIAAAKFEAVAAKLDVACYILVADTIVIVDSDILVKPDDDYHGAEMLRRLAGRSHEVSTRFVLGRGADVLHAETVRTEVHFRALEAAEISAYVRTGEGRDKAGSYAIQGRAAAFVDWIRGSYSSVVGLPAAEVWVAWQRALQGAVN